MEWREIRDTILNDEGIVAREDKTGRINVANCDVSINHKVCFRNVYRISHIGTTLWINNNSMDLSDVEKIYIWSD